MSFRTLFVALIAALLPGLFAHGQPVITLTEENNSSIIINGYTPYFTVNAPQAGGLDTADAWCNGGICDYSIGVRFSVDSFNLGENTIGSFPCASESPLRGCDTCWKGDGQYIFVAIDKGPPLAVKDINSGVVNIPIESPTPGPHTLVAFLSRSWDESVKNVNAMSPTRETRFYSVRTFYLDTVTGTHGVDSTKPLLVPNSPLDTNLYKYPPDSVLLDFYMIFRGLSDGYVVEVTVYDSTDAVLTIDTLETWAPHCIGGLEEPPANRLRKYFIRTRLLQTDGTPVSNGPGNMNDRKWAFWVREQ